MTNAPEGSAMSDKPVYQAALEQGLRACEELFERDYFGNHDITMNALHVTRERFSKAASAYEALKKDRNMYKVVCEQWIEKTEWVQQDKSNLFFGSLGLHRADAMTKAIEALKAENEAQAKRIAKLEQIHGQISATIIKGMAEICGTPIKEH